MKEKLYLILRVLFLQQLLLLLHRSEYLGSIQEPLIYTFCY